MTYRQIALSIMCTLSLGGLFNQAHGAQAAATVTKTVAQKTYPLFSKPIFSPQLTTSLASFLVRSKGTLQTASWIGCGIALLMGIYYKMATEDAPVHTKLQPDAVRYMQPSHICWGLAIGLPVVTRLALELLAVPTIGLSTTIAGE